jgi:hypothetical protein
MSTANSAIQVAEIGGKGRGLKATRVVPAGEVVFAVKPLILVPALSHMATVCSNCFKIGQPRACTRCHAAYYCDAACQRAHWGAIHKLECRPLGRAFAAYESMMPTPARMLLQALVKDDIGAALEGLVGHEDKCRAKKDEWENYELLAKAVCEYTGKGDAQLARAAGLICKVCYGLLCLFLCLQQLTQRR